MTLSFWSSCFILPSVGISGGYQPPWPSFCGPGDGTWISCMLGKRSTKWVTSTAHKATSDQRKAGEVGAPWRRKDKLPSSADAKRACPVNVSFPTTSGTQKATAPVSLTLMCHLEEFQPSQASLPKKLTISYWFLNHYLQMSSVGLVDFQLFKLGKHKTAQLYMHTKPLYTTKAKLCTLRTPL